jgi:hypothetical protein
LSGSRVVKDEIQLFISRNDQVGVRATRAGQFQIHITGYAGSAVRDSDGRVSTGNNRLSHIARNSLLQQGAHVVICGNTPRT